MLDRLGRGREAQIRRNSSTASGFFAQVLKESALLFRKRQVGFKVLVMQILFTGVEALRISAVMALAIGAAINLDRLLASRGVRSEQVMYTMLIVVIARELGPLLTAFIVIARSGTAIATELGGMAVAHEMEAYVAVGINPISYLAAPRFLGVVISMLVLTIYFNLFGLLGSFAVVQLIKPIGIRANISATSPPRCGQAIWASGFVKAFVFGVIVSVVSLYRGFSVERSIDRSSGRGDPGGRFEFHALHPRGCRLDDHPVRGLAA